MVAIGAFVASLTVARIVVPHNRSIWQRCLLLPLPAKLGWFVQEAPALCVPLFLITSVGGRYIEKMNANSILLGMFLLHYVHRTLIYPLYMKGRPTPLYTVLLASMFSISIHSDMVLQGLCKPGETETTTIPHGGFFEYVSAPNYFGEALEWMGYALASLSLPAMAFAIFTSLHLGSHALVQHESYLKKFDDYPKNRKAFVPFWW
ncbi:hypothetical protein EMCRGX_G033079 [Ephydatia muelleri]